MRSREDRPQYITTAGSHNRRLDLPYFVLALILKQASNTPASRTARQLQTVSCWWGFLGERCLRTGADWPTRLYSRSPILPTSASFHVNHKLLAAISRLVFQVSTMFCCFKLGTACCADVCLSSCSDAMLVNFYLINFWIALTSLGRT